jgi:branched-chain amino acid transport system substrate-binding protein
MLKNMRAGAALAATVALTLSGCGSGGDGESSGSKDPIKVGYVFSLTGPAAAYGRVAKANIETMVKAYNAAGGVHGHKIEAIIEDDGTDPTRASRAATKLIRGDQVIALDGASSGTSVQAMAPIFAQSKVPMLTGNGNSQLTDPGAAWYPYFYVVNAKDEVASIAILNRASADGAKRIAVFYSEDGYGESGLKTYQEMDKPAGVSIVSTASSSAAATSVTAQINKLKAAKPDAIIMQLAAPGLAAAIGREVKAAGLDAKLYGAVGVAQKSFLEVAGADGDGVRAPVYVMPGDLTAGQTELYDFYKKNGYEVRNDYLDIHFAAAFKILTSALERADSLDAAGLKKALDDGTCVEAYEYEKVCYTPDNHTPLTEKAFRFADVKDGKLVPAP